VGTAVTNQNCIHAKIKSKSNSGNPYYRSVQNLSSRLSSKILKIKMHKTIILPVVLYGCEAWSLTLREQHGLKMLKKRVLGRIFGPKRDETPGGRRRLQNEELHNLYASPNIIGEEMGGARSTHGRDEKRM
jgi:hypothetical protein